MTYGIDERYRAAGRSDNTQTHTRFYFSLLRLAL